MKKNSFKVTMFVLSFLMFTFMISSVVLASTSTQSNENISYVTVGGNCPYGNKHSGHVVETVACKSNNLSGIQNGVLYQCQCGAQLICTGNPPPHTPYGYIGYYTGNFKVKNRGSIEDIMFAYYECGSMSYSKDKSLPTWEFH